MIDPTLAFQTAIRSHLVASPTVTALVHPDHIHAGSTRPASFPTIIVGNGTAIMHGRASGGQYVATVFLDLHIWTNTTESGSDWMEVNGLDHAKAIGAAVAHALIDWPDGLDFEFDDFKHTRTVWPRDPDPSFGHGVLSLEAVIRWRL